jgi:hypothetical protein
VADPVRPPASPNPLARVHTRIAGRGIRRVETQIAIPEFPDTLGVEFELDDRALLAVWAVDRKRHRNRLGAGYARIALAWRYAPPKARPPRISLAGVRWHRDDGSEEQKVLNEWMVGRRIERLVGGALGDNDDSVDRLDLTGNLTVFVAPVPLGHAWYPSFFAFGPGQERSRVPLAGAGFLEV